MQNNFVTDAINLKSYNLSESDKIIVMYAGKIVEEGTSRQIFYERKHRPPSRAGKTALCLPLRPERGGF